MSGGAVQLDVGSVKPYGANGFSHSLQLLWRARIEIEAHNVVTTNRLYIRVICDWSIKRKVVLSCFGSSNIWPLERRGPWTVGVSPIRPCSHTCASAERVSELRIWKPFQRGSHRGSGAAFLSRTQSPHSVSDLQCRPQQAVTPTTWSTSSIKRDVKKKLLPRPEARCFLEVQPTGIRLR